MEDYLAHLNEQQREAVTWCDGPQLVIAGAGSGKTRVLTYKIVHLLAHGHEPWRIMALTFTNKAAREMRERIQALVGEKGARKLWMGTFHSIFARILRQHADRIGFPSNFTIYDASDSRSLIKMILRDADLDETVYKPATVASAISWAKNSLMSPQDYANDADLRHHDRECGRSRMPEIYAAYVDRCRVAGAMDFDDLLYYTNVLLRDNPDICNHYREFFRYVLVDEYQDTNFAQHLIVNRLTRGQGNIMMVGDDAQSIYSFRGANIDNILALEKSYPGLRVFKLEQNYRSTKAIVKAANSLIAKNEHQIRKEVFSAGEEGKRPEVVRSYSDYEEAYLVTTRISHLHLAERQPWDEIAILYRTNAQSRVLEEQLRKRNIPYRIYGGLSFYQRKEVRDALSYLRLTVNPDDDEALRRIINFPTRGIGDTTQSKIAHAALERQCSMWQVLCDPADLPVNAGTRKKLEDFRQLIQYFHSLELQGLNVYQIVLEVIERTRLLSMLLTDRTPESISRQENLQELIGAAKDHVEQSIEEDGDPSLQGWLATVSLATDQDGDEGEGDKVTLMTAHAAKGLEFGNVFVVGVEEELFPSSMAKSASEVEEERRLLYVAITRAKRFCMLTYADTRFRNGMTQTTRPSRFLTDIESELLNDAGANLRAKASRQDGGLYGGGMNPMVNYRRTASASLASSRSRVERDPKGLHVAAELKPGMRILHSKFGQGTILNIDVNLDDERIQVEFDNTGQRTLMLRFARFKIL